MRAMSSPLRLRFVQSASSYEQLPESVTEVALLGRSNVGKSSLINALANRKELARTSKTPGATQLINIFELDPQDSGRWLVDLPGYGFAKVPKAVRARFTEMIEEYLAHSESLDTLVLLIDGAVGPTDLDLATVDWLRHFDKTLLFVATKADKVRASKSAKRRKEVSERLGVPKGQIMWVSASKGDGIPELRARIAKELVSVDEPL